MPGNCGVSESSYIIKLKESIAADFFFYQIHMEYSNLSSLVEAKVMTKASNLDTTF